MLGSPGSADPRLTPRIPRDPPSEPAAGDGPRCRDSFQARVFVCRPTVMLSGAQVWGPAPGDPPSARGAPGNPGGSPAPGWSFGGAAAGGGTESPPPGVTAAELPPHGPAARGIAAPHTLGPAARQGGGAPLAALCCGNRMWFGM